MAKTLIETHHPLTVLRVIDLYTESDRFVGLPLLKMILELILVSFPLDLSLSFIFYAQRNLIQSINTSTHNEYKVPDVIEIAVLTFKKVLETFPPCWSAALADYRHLILDPIGANGLLQGLFPPRALGFLSDADSPVRLGDDFDPNENLLSHLLRFIECLIQPVSMVTPVKEVLNDSELMKDFCLWIETLEQKYQVSG